MVFGCSFFFCFDFVMLFYHNIENNAIPKHPKLFALQILKINHSESGSFCRFSFCIDANFYFNVSMYQI